MEKNGDVDEQVEATLDLDTETVSDLEPGPNNTICDQSHGNMDYEADHSAR